MLAAGKIGRQHNGALCPPCFVNGIQNGAPHGLVQRLEEHLDRTTGCSLNNKEIKRYDAEQGGNYKQ